MRKVTYTNAVNGLSVEFSSENPLMHLDMKNFDGSSLGADSIAYSPIDFDGQKIVSTSLSARTIVLPFEFTAKKSGKFSRSEALKLWENICNVFVPIHKGMLVWTDGTRSRQIECRAAETPKITQVLPYMFSASVHLVADFPYWEDTVENKVVLDVAAAPHYTITNSCALAVPCYIDISNTDDSLMSFVNATTGGRFGFGGENPSGTFTIDSKKCAVILSDGTYGNHFIAADSEYFWLAPGVNKITMVGSAATVAIRWRNLYLGVE